MSSDRLLWLPTCGSTNDEARLRWDDPAVTAVATDHQTAGRGRRGRTWFSPPGAGLYLTYIVRGGLRPLHAGVLPLLAGVVTARLCERLGARPELKWPNDLLLRSAGEGHRKLAGILCESRVQGEELTALLGIGLNLRAPPGGYPADVPAVALETAESAESLAPILVGDLQAALSGLSPGDPFAAVLPAWRDRGPVLGTSLRCGEHMGAFAGLSADGSLMLDTPAGRVQIGAGEVFFGA